MAVLRIPVFAAFLLLGWKQAQASTSELSEAECAEGGGVCRSAGKCASPSWAQFGCKGQADDVCCNPASLRGFQRSLNLDGFEVDEKIRPCSNRKCLGWYGGFWTADPATCTPKQRLVNYCATTDMYCCAPPCCEGANRCEKRGGYCSPRKSLCPGKARHRLCRAKMCFCCLPPYPAVSCPCSNNMMSICDTTSLALAADTCVQVESPNNPLAYGSNTACPLTITTAAHCKLRVQYCYVNLETCPYDVLTVDGNAHCGVIEPPPADYVSADNTLTLDFTTDFCQVNRGFQLAITSECSCDDLPHYDICSETIVTTNVGVVIHTPNYPAPYAVLQSCSVRIQTTAGKTFQLTYDTPFELEGPYPTCPYDTMAVDDTVNIGTSPIYCGTTTPGFVASTTNDVTINFLSDKSGVFSGFKICLTVV